MLTTLCCYITSVQYDGVSLIHAALHVGRKRNPRYSYHYIIHVSKQIWIDKKAKRRICLYASDRNAQQLKTSKRFITVHCSIVIIVVHLLLPHYTTPFTTHVIPHSNHSNFPKVWKTIEDLLFLEPHPPSALPCLPLCSGLNVISSVSVSPSTWAVSRQTRSQLHLVSADSSLPLVSGCLAVSQPWPNTLQSTVKSLGLSSLPRHRQRVRPLCAREES